MNKDLLKISKIMAVFAIFFAAIATLIAYFSISSVDFLITPIIVLAVFVWVLSVAWFLWGWLKNANVSGNEGKGINASTFILAFLPLCYCFLMATDDSRTKVKVKVLNEFAPISAIRVYGSGSIFLNQDTLKLAGLTKGEYLVYNIKAATAPGMRGAIVMEGVVDGKPFSKEIAGPFTINPMNITTDWKVVIGPDFF